MYELKENYTSYLVDVSNIGRLPAGLNRMILISWKIVRADIQPRNVPRAQKQTESAMISQLYSKSWNMFALAVRVDNATAMENGLIPSMLLTYSNLHSDATFMFP